MKKTLLTLILFFVVLLVSAQQYRDNSLQPDSIYKANKVRSRIAVHPGSPSKSKEIFVFDQEGRPVAFILTDNETGNLPQLKMVYTYNDKGILSGETDSLFRENQYAVKLSELFYGPDRSLARQVVKNSGHLVSEKYFYPMESKMIEKLYRNDTIYREQTTIYDVHGKQVRFTGKELADHNAQPKVIVLNGKTYTFNPSKTDLVWDYTFINTYDQFDNLLIQERFDSGQMKGKTNFAVNGEGLFTGINHDVKFSYMYY